MIRIYGASDDLIEIEGDVDEEIYADDGDRAVLLIGELQAGLVVTVRYAANDEGVWQVAAEPVAEDVPCPWPVRLEFKGYTAVLVVDAPRGTRVRKAHPRDGWVPLKAPMEDEA